MNQTNVIRTLNIMFPFMDELKEAEDRFSSYDCENDMYIIEIKSRDRSYNPWIIERDKYISNLNTSRRLGKQFIYLTEYQKKILTWNINDLIANNYSFNWELREMPQTTEFKNNNPVLKEVGYLYEQYAKKIL